MLAATAGGGSGISASGRPATPQHAGADRITDATDAAIDEDRDISDRRHDLLQGSSASRNWTWLDVSLLKLIGHCVDLIFSECSTVLPICGPIPPCPRMTPEVDYGPSGEDSRIRPARRAERRFLGDG
ncbi:MULTISPECIES: hypothetical protein [Nocardia]|uniref:hypothetical protein n=1 Tax=Nocardia abscessus TaxID=120957 RepID=UPI00245408D4|nr:hypothetical protein [Nocardia abscessus]